MKILLVKLNAIGDVLFATPLAGALRQVHEAPEIDWLVGRHAEAVLRGHPAIRERILYDGPWGGVLAKARALATLPRLILQLRARHYDQVFCLHRSHFARLVCRATGAKVRVGFAGRLSALTLTKAVPFDATAHETERYLALLRAQGHRFEHPGMSVGLTDEAQVVAQLMLVDAGAREPLLGLAPGGGRNPGTEMLIKRWPAERYAELARALVEQTGGSVVVVGSADEEELCAAVAEAAGEGAVNACGRTTLPQLAALLARCAVVVANDSGPLHIAAATGVPTVALFGPTDPRLVAPIGERHRYLWAPPDCGPCYRPDNASSRRIWTCARRDDELRCLRDVGLETVLAAVRDALAGVPWPTNAPYEGPVEAPEESDEEDEEEDPETPDE